MAEAPYIIVYRIDRTDAGTPAWGCYMADQDRVARYYTREAADADARGTQEFMRRSGYSIMYLVVDASPVLDYVTSTRFALTWDDVAWDVFEHGGERFGVTS